MPNHTMPEMKGEHRYYQVGPDAYAVEARATMLWIDSQPLEWRLFIHEYGSRTAQLAQKKGLTPRIAERNILAARAKRMRAATVDLIASIQL